MQNCYSTPITGVGIENLSVDIVIPLSDKYSYGEGYDNRASAGTTISSMAFVPGTSLMFLKIFSYLLKIILMPGQ